MRLGVKKDKLYSVQGQPVSRSKGIFGRESMLVIDIE